MLILISRKSGKISLYSHFSELTMKIILTKQGGQVSGKLWSISGKSTHQLDFFIFRIFLTIFYTHPNFFTYPSFSWLIFFTFTPTNHSSHPKNCSFYYLKGEVSIENNWSWSGISLWIGRYSINVAQTMLHKMLQRQCNQPREKI